MKTFNLEDLTDEILKKEGALHVHFSKQAKILVGNRAPRKGLNFYSEFAIIIKHSEDYIVGFEGEIRNLIYLKYYFSTFQEVINIFNEVLNNN